MARCGEKEKGDSKSSRSLIPGERRAMNWEAGRGTEALPWTARCG